MNTTSCGRVLAGSVLLALSTTMLVPHAAEGAPVDGSVTSGVQLPYSGNCSITGDGDTDTRTFSSSGPSTVADAAESFDGVEPGTSNVAMTANATSATRAGTKAEDGSFKKVKIKATHVASLTDTADWDCGAEVVADSQTGLSMRIKRNAAGKVLLRWNRSDAGRIAQIQVTGPGGATVLDITPSKAEGERRFKVQRGSYYLFVQFQTSVREADVTTGETGQSEASFKVTAKRLP